MIVMIREALINKKSVIVEKWIDAILGTYPSVAFDFFKTKKNQFSNPVGYTISGNAEKIFNEIINDRNPDKIKLLLDDIVKMRAVQNLPPSKAVGFVLLLKKLIHDELAESIKDQTVLDEFLNLESFIDRVALIAFDSFMESREKLFNIRVNEIKSKSFKFPTSASSN
ncbi:MAG: RsbRD N-terminal domain-containing protein [Ignavibacteria bacterium]|jgi:hypothetical protein